MPKERKPGHGDVPDPRRKKRKPGERAPTGEPLPDSGPGQTPHDYKGLIGGGDAIGSLYPGARPPESFRAAADSTQATDGDTAPEPYYSSKKKTNPLRGYKIERVSNRDSRLRKIVGVHSLGLGHAADPNELSSFLEVEGFPEEVQQKGPIAGVRTSFKVALVRHVLEEPDLNDADPNAAQSELGIRERRVHLFSTPPMTALSALHMGEAFLKNRAAEVVAGAHEELSRANIVIKHNEMDIPGGDVFVDDVTEPNVLTAVETVSWGTDDPDNVLTYYVARGESIFSANVDPLQSSPLRYTVDKVTVHATQNADGEWTTEDEVEPLVQGKVISGLTSAMHEAKQTDRARQQASAQDTPAQSGGDVPSDSPRDAGGDRPGSGNDRNDPPNDNGGNGPGPSESDDSGDMDFTSAASFVDSFVRPQVGKRRHNRAEYDSEPGIKAWVVEWDRDENVGEPDTDVTQKTKQNYYELQVRRDPEEDPNGNITRLTLYKRSWEKLDDHEAEFHWTAWVVEPEEPVIEYTVYGLQRTDSRAFEELSPAEQGQERRVDGQIWAFKNWVEEGRQQQGDVGESVTRGFSDSLKIGEEALRIQIPQQRRQSPEL